MKLSSEPDSLIGYAALCHDCKHEYESEFLLYATHDARKHAKRKSHKLTIWGCGKELFDVDYDYKEELRSFPNF